MGMGVVADVRVTATAEGLLRPQNATAGALPQLAQVTGTVLPCDTFASGGTPCVAAFSTVRSIRASYTGPLYQVTRASDGRSTDIGLVSGYAAAGAQDAFCVSTVCTIVKLYDQSPQHNDLTVTPVGAAGSSGIGARADALPVTVAGHPVYGILMTPRVGYRKSIGSGMAVNGQPESMYEVASGTFATAACCSDFGNVETTPVDTGPAHMDAIIISSFCAAAPCSGVGPWIQADLEDGVFASGGASNLNSVSQTSPFITAVLRNNGQTAFALDGGDATSPTLTSLYNGSLPAAYAPMKQEGGIALGTGGDNSNAAPGSFFEGAITSGFASNATIAAIQSDIDAANYTGTSGGGPGVGITGPGGKCIDVAGSDNGGNLSNVHLGTCLHDAVDQHWQYIRTVPTISQGAGQREYPDTLKTLGRCLDIRGNATSPGTQVALYDCNGVGGQKWVQQPNGTLLNPQSGLCLTSPGGSTTNGTVLDIETCTGTASQRFIITVGELIQSRPISAPGGKCVDVVGDNTGVNLTNIAVWDCQREANDQGWWQAKDQSISTLGRCLDIKGNVTTAGTQVQLYDCSGVSGQKWVQQANGTLLNPRSGLCLTTPGGNTTNGTVLTIDRCVGSVSQQFTVTGGHPIDAPGGKCVDVAGNDLYGNWQLPIVQMWDCIPTAVDQHWVHTPQNTLETLTRCLDIGGNSTVAGSKVYLYNCNGVGGQQWLQQADGTLRNPQSGLCLTDPGSNTSNGIQLEIQTCTGAANQIFTHEAATALTPGATLSMAATTACCTSSWIRHQTGQGRLTPIGASSSTADKADSTWIVRPGLANSACVSFESKNFPGGYLRQRDRALYQEQSDGSSGFATDATFCAEPGKSGQGVSLSWAGNSSLFVRHYAGQIYLASNGGANAWDSPTSWASDVSWRTTPAWLP